MGGDLAEKFHAAHRARYGFAFPERTVEVVTVRARGIVRAPRVEPPRGPVEQGPPQIGGLTSRWDGRAHETPILARARLRDGMRVDGPALITEYSATTYLPPGAALAVEGDCLRITLA
jgi:N-methylhydantoinase A